MSDELRLVPIEDEPSTGLKLVPVDAPPSRTWVQYADNVMQQAIGGLTLGYDDEMLGGLAGGLNILTNGRTKTQDQFLQEYRARDRAFQESDPITSTAASIIGSMAMPGGSLLGGATKVAMGANATKALNAGITGRVAQAVLDGVVAGTGESEGDISKRLVSGLATGALSGGLTGGVSGIVSGGGAIGRNVANRLGVEGFDPTIKKIGDTLGLDSVTVPILREAQERLALANEYKIPLNVLDSITTPVVDGGDTAKNSLYNLAKEIAQTLDGGIMESQVALKSRGQGRFDRINNILEQITPNVGVREASSQFSDYADDAVKRARKRLAQEEGQLYKQMFEEYPTITSDRIKKLIDIETPEGVPSIKKTLDNAYIDYKIEAIKKGEDIMPKSDFETSTRGWVEVRKSISNTVEGLKSGNDSEKYSKLRTVGMLKDLVDEELDSATNGSLSKANLAYALKYAAEPEVLEQTGVIARAAKDKSLGASPLARIKEVYGKSAVDPIADIAAVSKYAGDDANRLGLRAGLGASYSNSGENPARELLKNDSIEKQMSSILGKEQYSAIRKLLNFENTIQTNTQGLTQGSPTGTKEYNIAKELGLLGKIPGVGMLGGVASEMLSSNKTNEYSKLANALFRTGDEGSMVLEDVIKYMDRAEKIKPVNDAFRQTTISSGRVLAPTILDILLGK